MPFKTIKSLPAKIKDALPVSAQKTFLSAFNTAFDKHGEEKAFKIAWAVVKNKFLKKGNNWVAKGSICLPRVYNAKSALSADKVYMADFVFADTKEDLDGDEIPVDTLLTKINGMHGDLEHARLFNRQELSQEDLFEVVDSFFDGSNLVGTVRFYPNHPQFPTVWEQCKNGKFGISMEYKKLEDVVGITGTLAGRNPRSKVLAVYDV